MQIRKKVIPMILMASIMLVSNSTGVLASQSTIDKISEETIKLLTPYEKIKLQEYEIVEIDKQLSNEDKHGKDLYIFGTINKNDRKIGIVDTKDEYKMTRVMCHEIGHMIDFDNNMYKQEGVKYSDTEEFRAIFDRNREKLKNYSNEHFFYDKYTEAFAESFGMYLQDRERIKDIAPEIYEYFNKLEAQLESINEFMLSIKGDGDYYIRNGEKVSGWVTDKQTGYEYYYSPSDYKMVRSAVIDGKVLSPSGNRIK